MGGAGDGNGDGDEEGYGCDDGYCEMGVAMALTKAMDMIIWGWLCTVTSL